jgi:hypothetical protein
LEDVDSLLSIKLRAEQCLLWRSTHSDVNFLREVGEEMDAVSDELNLEILFEEFLLLALVIECCDLDLVGVVADVDSAKTILRVIGTLE